MNFKTFKGLKNVFLLNIFSFTSWILVGPREDGFQAVPEAAWLLENVKNLHVQLTMVEWHGIK